MIHVKYAVQLKILQNLKRQSLKNFFHIVKDPLDCNSKNVIYLFECKKCQSKFPYVGSTVTAIKVLVVS